MGKRQKERERKGLEKTISNNRGPQRRTAVVGGKTSGLNSWEPYTSLAISSPPQYQAETDLKGGTFPMERPCSSISFSSQPSLGFGGACNHPVPNTRLSGGLGQASHCHLSCPCIYFALGTSQQPTGSTLPCQAPVGCSLVPVVTAHQQESHGPPDGPTEIFWHHWREKKHPTSHSRICSGFRKKTGSRPQHGPGNSNLTPLGFGAGLKGPGQHPHASTYKQDL